MISPNGCRCPPDCVGSQRACIKQSRSASGQRNRERKGVAVLVGYTAEEYVLHQSRNLMVGADWKYNFIFLQFLQLTLKCQTKIRERTCIAFCRWEMSSGDLISYDMRRRKESRL